MLAREVLWLGRHQLRMHEVLRYPSKDRDLDAFGNYRNIYSVTAGGSKWISLERGINTIAGVLARETVRRPAILIRSSPWKAGTSSTPWHDVFDLDHGHVRYFGDHKVSTPGALGTSRGNAALLQEFEFHRGSTRAQRLLATPLLLFRAVPAEGVQKGYVEFCGLGVLERAERIVQWDERAEASFPNYVYDIAVLDLSAEDETFDWNWINARRDCRLSAEGTLRGAPLSWREWVRHGDGALDRLRRRVGRNAVRPRQDQLPASGTPERAVLDRVYRAFDQRKHAFESLASSVAGRVLGSEGSGSYLPGWLTRPSGDRGVDFVARLDAGSGYSVAKLVVLGQAKCIAPDGPGVSAEQLARVVARLRRGWIGAYVTTGVFSEPAQQEMVEDEYPVVLVSGLRLSQEVRLMAYESYAGNVDGLLEDVLTNHVVDVTHRRPEEILLL